MASLQVYQPALVGTSAGFLPSPALYVRGAPSTGGPNFVQPGSSVTEKPMDKFSPYCGSSVNPFRGDRRNKHPKSEPNSATVIDLTSNSDDEVSNLLRGRRFVH